jgi:ferrous iron transport protein A
MRTVARGFLIENKSHSATGVDVMTSPIGNGSLRTLAQADVGCDLRIQALEGPGCDKLRRMGFCEEMEVRKLAGGRNLVCSLCGSRLALSSRLADQVLVSPVGA